MLSNAPNPTTHDDADLAAAREHDGVAFARLVAPYRGGLYAHCYRMLGSSQDAEDALQEALLRAWRGLPRYERRASLRTWLYAIATNVSLAALERRRRRVPPLDHRPPPRQRAVLLLRDVLGFGPAEIAGALEATPAAVYSTLQRAHAAVEDRLPERSQQATLRSLGDQRLRGLVERYVQAWEDGDV